MVEGTWLHMGSYRWFIGEWVKALMPNIHWKSKADVRQPMKENLDQVDQFTLVTKFMHTLRYAKKIYLLYCPLCCIGLTEVEGIEIGYNKKAGGLV